MDYADDVVLFAHKMDDLHGALEVFETTAVATRLTYISWQKTKIQNLGAGDSTSCPPACGHSLEEVTEFTYLGSVQCSFYFGQVSTRHYQAHWHRFYCHALYEQSLARDLASTADKTSLVPDLYTVHFVVWFGDVDTFAGGSTEAGGLSYALPTYDPRDMLA